MQTFDLKMMKPIFQYEVDAGVLSLDSNGLGQIAMGNSDRLARVYEAGSPFGLVGCTKNETMPVSSVVFHEEKYLLTGGTDNLKVWDVGSSFTLTDNIETTSKGILHMVVSDKIQQIAFSAGTLSYHQCPLSEVSFKGPYTHANHSISYEKIERVDEAIERNNKIKRGTTLNDPLLHISNEKTKSLIVSRNENLKQLSGISDNMNDVLSTMKKVS